MFAAVRRGAGLCVLLLAEAAALVVLLEVGRRPAFALPWHRLGTWLETAPPGDVLVALLRVLALAGVGWLSATTLLYTLAAAARLPVATRALRWSTIAGVRRVVDAAFVASVVSVTVVTPLGANARAGEATTVSVGVRDGRTAASEPSTTATPTPPAPSTPATPTPATPAPPTPSAPIAGAVIVGPGDNLWELAAGVVAAASGRDRHQVADVEIAPYWVRVCDVNAPRLSSGDLDLVFPGERIELPPYA